MSERAAQRNSEQHDSGQHDPGRQDSGQQGPERESSAGRILEAALAILSEEGADAVTMRRVAAEAGVTAMATYKHYANREALLSAVADAGFRRMAETRSERSQAVGFEERIDGLVDDFLDFALGNPHLYSFMNTERRERARQFPDDFRQGESPTFTPVVRAVEDGIRQGFLREDDPVEVALAIVAQSQGLVQLYFGGRIALSEEDFRSLCRRGMWRTIDGLRS